MKQNSFILIVTNKRSGRNGNKKNSSMRFKIKFKNSNKKIIADLIELSDYLSSGTIKGINILGNLIVTLKSGGYLLIDEIENHLNKNIVINNIFKWITAKTV